MEKRIISFYAYGIGRVYPTNWFVHKPPADASVPCRNPYYLTDNRQDAAIFENQEDLDDFARKYILPISHEYHYEFAE